MDSVEKGFNDRLKKIQAIKMLGTGMDIGSLNEYAYEICLYLMLKIFRREITENPNRTRLDLVKMTEEVLRDLKLEAPREAMERIVDGLLWYKDPGRQDPFQCSIFNEETGNHEAYKFRYLKIDKEHTQFEKGGSFVYMLTEEAQEIIFITREILEEFGFDVEQFYTLQLIKSGNFHKAENSISNLIARVRTLIRKEKDYRQDIIRNPQIIFMDSNKNRGMSEEEVRRQFEDEQKVFDDMFAWKERIHTFPADKIKDAEKVFESLERARVLHNVLAKLVVENMAYEVEIRVKYPDSFWKTSTLTFKNDLWKNVIVKEGLPRMDNFEDILSPMFSPDTGFIYPLDWAWSEQKIKTYSQISYEDEDREEEYPYVKEVDWDNIVEVWSEVFGELLKKGEFSITELQNIDNDKREKWLRQKENIDLFMMFTITGIRLSLDYEGVDERLDLYKRLCLKDDRFKKLNGKYIAAVNEEYKKPLVWDEIFVSPYKIFIMEES